MKRKLKAIAAIFLVLIMFISAMPMQLAAEAMTPPTTRYATPDGYNDHDYQKMVAFFEQTDENGVRNGEKLMAVKSVSNGQSMTMNIVFAKLESVLPAWA